MKVRDVQVPKPIRISTTFQSQEVVREILKTAITIGRQLENENPDLDLHPDTTVSRRHARIWSEQDTIWIEDAGSRFGTFVNGQRLDQGSKRRLSREDVIRLGETELRVLLPADPRERFAQLKTEPAPGGENVAITTTVDARAAAPFGSEPAAAALLQRQAGLLELPLEFGTAGKLEDLLQAVMRRAVAAVPGAERGALLLRAQQSDALLLAAYISDDAPPVSETLARRAMTQGKAFIWRRTEQSPLPASVRELNILSGMYAPLIWNGKALGAICVDNTQNSAIFDETDLRLLLAVAHYSALFVANRRLQEDLVESTKVLERLLTNFSPKIRQILLEKARSGKLRPGGQESEVTILFSDIRGFARICADMDPADVVAMLNEYFPALAESIFEFDGTIDKFIGDAIFAVFGSPEPDEQHSSNAVRAAVAMQDAIREINARRSSRGEVVCEIGVGVERGKVLHGFVGFDDRLEFTVVGDAVNRAARYCDGAQAGEVLIGPQLFQHVFKMAKADKTQITTKHGETLAAYRLRGLATLTPAN